MSTNYRFSLLRPGGWSRLGLVGSVAVLFASPMLWALGVFGFGEDALRRALIFGFAGLWLSMALGYTLGWALKGFMVRLKDAEDEGDEPRRPGHPPGPAVHAQPGLHAPGGGRPGPR